ncbi:MAG: DUF3352 domain-containing protein [Bacteroides sp.]
MKLRTVIKMAMISSIVLLCTGFVMYSFFKLSVIENHEEFNLYTLVPATSSAVLEIGDVASLVQDVNDLQCSKDHHFLYVSKLFSILKTHLYSLLEDAPHGLSRQMNKMLLSFHEPDNAKNQVLYCSLGSGDYELIKSFIQKNSSKAFPSKMFDYKGEEICIYPMSDGSFLSTYVTSRYAVISYQKKLIEKVIDTRLTAQSLSEDDSFNAVHQEKKGNTSSIIYVRMHSLDMGKMTDGIHSQASLGGWTEFEIRMNGRSLYFSGTSHDTDTCLTFMNMLRKQQAIEGFPGDILPASTFLFSKRSVSDLQSMFNFTVGRDYAKTIHSNYIKVRDDELLRYLEANGGTEITTCLFVRKDTLPYPAAVMSIPVNNVTEAEWLLKDLLKAMPKEEGVSPVQAVALCRTRSKIYTLYRLPSNTLFTQLTGIIDTPLCTYASFYADRILLAPDEESLRGYMNHLEEGEVLTTTATYAKQISGLSNAYHFMLVADLEKVFCQPENYVRLVPSFFFRNAEFFSHFTLSSQFTCADGVVYPNVVLLYKDE